MNETQQEQEHCTSNRGMSAGLQYRVAENKVAAKAISRKAFATHWGSIPFQS